MCWRDYTLVEFWKGTCVKFPQAAHLHSSRYPVVSRLPKSFRYSTSVSYLCMQLSVCVSVSMVFLLNFIAMCSEHLCKQNYTIVLSCIFHFGLVTVELF